MTTDCDAISNATARMVKDADLIPSGTILELRPLGVIRRNDSRAYDVSVVFLRYHSSVDGGCRIAAKLYVPLGDAPKRGWPASVWCHGFGDPATQLQRWPLRGNNWRRSRGELAGGWAHNGIVTLTPWLPGDGPSEPLGTYSPLSLRRNAQALADGFSALKRLAFAGDTDQPGGDELARLDHTRLILRADCIGTATLIYFAAHWRDFPDATGLCAMVADNFQPSIAYNEWYLGRFVNNLPLEASAAIRCIWARHAWSLWQHQRWPVHELFSPPIVELFSEAIGTPIGLLPEIVASRLVPVERSELGPIIAAVARREFCRDLSSMELREWMYAGRLRRWAVRPRLEDMIRDEFYQEFLAPSDPFFF